MTDIPGDPKYYDTILNQILDDAGIGPEARARIDAPSTRPLIANCPVCKQSCNLRADGTIPHHTQYGTAQVGYRTPWCTGSKERP
ncbi:hypothetical protein OG689_10730 [Kitasatospora sp. NBC_00240]|uniref:hypothetical protein n=1 Tax=Kitasatospora sp. NBC_00240 TaxID=2903567 RepID=UPI00224D4A89|nr:hypothetical protein [Kitasatospora sp. NBC_00240]MCX5209758.1 hypothetical protein [Kitasatospora sp. NBC_00240]